MAKLLIDFIDAVENIRQKIFKGKNGYYFPKITSDQLCFDRNHQRFSGEVVPDCSLKTAIKKSQSHLLSEQKEGKYWAGILEGDVALTAEYLMLMHFLKRIDPRKEEKAIRYIIKKQEKDSGWGETCKSYWDTSLSPIGKSAASQTSWAVL